MISVCGDQNRRPWPAVAEDGGDQFDWLPRHRREDYLRLKLIADPPNWCLDRPAPVCLSQCRASYRGPLRLSRPRSRYYDRRVRQLLRLQARDSRRPTQRRCSMNDQPFNKSFNILASGPRSRAMLCWPTASDIVVVRIFPSRAQAGHPGVSLCRSVRR